MREHESTLLAAALRSWHMEAKSWCMEAGRNSNEEFTFLELIIF